jgi:glycosyltransferase involved in cell wall biosynthesis
VESLLAGGPVKVSVVIPCFGRQEVLDLSLRSLLNQTRPADEIIVVDDGTEPPITVPDGVRLLRIERKPGYRGSSAAKNFGAKHATSDWLAFTDNDIIHLPDALESVVRLAEAGPENILYDVFSISVPEKLRTKEPETIAGFMDHRTFDGKSAGIISTEQHLGLIRKDFFDSIGGYDEETFKSWGLNNQDLCLRVRNAGGVVVSDIYRISNGRLLHCFHPEDPENEVHHVKEVRESEFKSKWGKRYGGFSAHRLS